MQLVIIANEFWENFHCIHARPSWISSRKPPANQRRERENSNRTTIF